MICHYSLESYFFLWKIVTYKGENIFEFLKNQFAYSNSGTYQSYKVFLPQKIPPSKK